MVTQVAGKGNVNHLETQIIINSEPLLAHLCFLSTLREKLNERHGYIPQSKENRMIDKH